MYFLFYVKAEAQVAPELYLAENEFNICKGEEVEVVVNVSGRPETHITYTHNGGAEHIAASMDNSISLDLTEPGEYIIVSYGNMDSVIKNNPDTFFIYEQISPNIKPHPDTTLCFELEEHLRIQLDDSSGDEFYWPHEDITSSSFRTEMEGVYTYIRTNQYGCSETSSIRVFNNCEPNFHVPEAFTPNRDGINDELLLFGIYTRFEFTILSSSGIVIFQSNSEDIVWDGNHKGKPMPVGTYYWFARFWDNRDVLYTKSGTVTIIR